MRLLNLGLIGAGRWGRRYIHTVSGMPDVRLARLASSNPESASICPIGCEVTRDWRSVAEDSSLDGVIIATPPSLHATMARAVVESGGAALIEKPLTLSLLEAQRLVEVAEAAGRLVMVGHTHLFSEAFRELKKHGREMGSLKEIRSSAGNWGPRRADAPMLWDWAPHDIAMCLEMFGSSPVAIRARRIGVAALPEGDGEAVAIELEFPGGALARIRVSNIDATKSRYFEARFAGGALIYDDMSAEKLCLISQLGDAPVPFILGEALPLGNLVTAFCTEIRAKSKKHDSLDLGLRVVQVLDQCERLIASVDSSVPTGEQSCN